MVKHGVSDVGLENQWKDLGLLRMHSPDQVSSSVGTHRRMFEVEEEEIKAHVGCESCDIAVQNRHAASDESLT